jgi:hypothetical protein
MDRGAYEHEESEDVYKLGMRITMSRKRSLFHETANGGRARRNFRDGMRQVTGWRFD